MEQRKRYGHAERVSGGFEGEAVTRMLGRGALVLSYSSKGRDESVMAGDFVIRISLCRCRKSEKCGDRAFVELTMLKMETQTLVTRVSGQKGD